MNLKDFQLVLTRKGEELYRDMPWRGDTRPYYVLVSELMLQQTQVARVVPKFEAFIQAFPSEEALASASLADIIKYWQGLGYNRRAKYLYEAAKQIVKQGGFPDNERRLVELPGVGKNTAGAILAYSFNYPSIFIETNIRTVYIHHFFGNNFDISDNEIIELLKETIDVSHPREFYWALMDYGNWLKSNGVRNNSQSKHYKKQSQLSGSMREMRGLIIQKLSNNVSVEGLRSDARFDKAVASLVRDGMIKADTGIIELTK
jgi:A/G-specific adenine glycosylase